MKNLTKNCLFLMIMVSMVFIAGCSSTKKAAAVKQGTEAVAANANVVGTWTFTVKGTPDGDTKGDMIISRNSDTLKGLISTGGAQTEIQDFKVVNNQLTGIFYFNGMTINMSGTFTGNSYEGKVEAQGYAFPMVATKI
jgi:hypothetical protein